MKHRPVLLIWILFIASCLPLVMTEQQTTIEPDKKIILAVEPWTFPDENGQGVGSIWLYFPNGSVFAKIGYPEYPYTEWEDFDDYNGNEWPYNTTLKIAVFTYVNGTFCGFSSLVEGKNYLRHNIAVSLAGEQIVSQQNLTYETGTDSEAPIYIYKHNIYLTCFDVTGIYDLLLDCEIYHEVNETKYLNDCSSLTGISFYQAGGLNEGEYGIGSNGSVLEFWIMPDAITTELVVYKIDFSDIDNTNNDLTVRVRYYIEGPSNYFYYIIGYNDSSFDNSGSGFETSWTFLDLIPDDDKTLDYIRLVNGDFPASTSSGNYSVWIDYIEIYRTYDDWNEVNRTEFLLCVPFDMWGINSTIILLGLVIIPASTMYLIIGAKHDRSSDRLYYGLIAFFIGWALLIGGIMP